MQWITGSLGIAVMILGVSSLICHGIPYTTREKVIVIGPLEATQEVKNTIPLPPILGGPLPEGSIVLVIIGAKKL